MRCHVLSSHQYILICQLPSVVARLIIRQGCLVSSCSILCLKIGSKTFRGIFFHFFGEFFSILGFPSFWKLFLWKVSEASHETILLEAFSVKIVGSIARNAGFGNLFCEISRKPRTKRSFWKLPLWILKKPRAKRSFWNLLLWNLDEASHEPIILELSSVKIVGSFARNARVGSFFCEIWSEASRETLVLEPSFVKFRWSLPRNDHFGTFFCENCRKLRTKRSF